MLKIGSRVNYCQRNAVVVDRSAFNVQLLFDDTGRRRWVPAVNVLRGVAK